MAITITKKHAGGVGHSDPTCSIRIDYALAASATATPTTGEFACGGATHIESVSLLSVGAASGDPTSGMNIRIFDSDSRNVLGGAASAMTVGDTIMPTPDGSQKYPAQFYGPLTLAASGNAVSGADFRIVINASK